MARTSFGLDSLLWDSALCFQRPDPIGIVSGFVSFAHFNGVEARLQEKPGLRSTTMINVHQEHSYPLQTQTSLPQFFQQEDSGAFGVEGFPLEDDDSGVFWDPKPEALQP